MLRAKQFAKMPLFNSSFIFSIYLNSMNIFLFSSVLLSFIFHAIGLDEVLRHRTKYFLQNCGQMPLVIKSGNGTNMYKSRLRKSKLLTAIKLWIFGMAPHIKKQNFTWNVKWKIFKDWKTKELFDFQSSNNFHLTCLIKLCFLSVVSFPKLIINKCQYFTLPQPYLAQACFVTLFNHHQHWAKILCNYCRQKTCSL